MINLRQTLLALATGGFIAGGAFAQSASWDWQLSEPVQPPDVSIFGTDPDAVTPEMIKQLGAAGVYTICYVSVGTVEKYRDDAGVFPSTVIGKTYGDWPDEKFLDIRHLDILLPIMKARFERCKAFGFHAVEPDNMDVFDNDSGFPLTRADGLRYIRALAEMAHRLGLGIGQKNVPELTGELVDTLDFVIAESCFQDGWCDEVTAYIRAGKLILDAEYTDEPINWQGACERAQKMGILMILKDRDLHAGGQSCNE